MTFSAWRWQECNGREALKTLRGHLPVFLLKQDLTGQNQVTKL